MEKKLFCSLLQIKSSFLRGWASIANLPGNFYRFNKAATNSDGDAKAFESDWQTLGRDFEIVFGVAEKIKHSPSNEHAET